MLGASLLIVFAWLVSKYGRPVAFAAGFAALNAVLGLITSGPSMGLLVAVAVAFTYAAVYLYIVQRVSDSILLLMLVVFVGAALYVMVPLFFIAAERA